MALQKERSHKVIDTLAAAAFLGTVTFGVHNMKSLQGTANSNSELAANDQNTKKQHIITGSSTKNTKSHKETKNNKKEDKNKDKDLSNLLASAASDVSKGSSKSAAIAKAADQAVNGNADLLKQVASNTAKNKNNNTNLDKLENHIIKDNLPNTPTQHDSKANSDIANSLTPKAPSSSAVVPNSGGNHVLPSSAVSNNGDHKVVPTPSHSTTPVVPTPTPSSSAAPTTPTTPTPSSGASSATPTPTPSSSAHSETPVTPSHSASSSTPSHAGSGNTPSGSASSQPTPHPDGTITSVPHNGNYSVTINFVDTTGNTIAKSLPVSVPINTDQKINDALTNQVNAQLKALGLDSSFNIAANGLPNYIVNEKDGSLTYTVPLADKSVPNTTGDGTIQGGPTTPATPTPTTPSANSSAETNTISIANVAQGNNANASTNQSAAQDTNTAINNIHSISTAGIDLQ